jgi:hypothetical protein
MLLILRERVHGHLSRLVSLELATREHHLLTRRDEAGSGRR